MMESIKINVYIPIHCVVKEIKHQHLVKVTSFLVANISCMADYVTTNLREVNPDYIILHAGAIDLRAEKRPVK